MKYFLQEKTRRLGPGEYEPGRYFEVDGEQALRYGELCLMMNRWAFVFIPVQLEDGSYLPVVDIDSFTHSINSGLISQEYIRSVCGDHRCALIRSSTYSHWLISDYVSPNFSDTLKYARKLDELCSGHTKYIDCAEITKAFVLRAIPKKGFIPTVIYNQLSNPPACEWLRNFQEHWKHPKIQDMVVIQTLNAL